ncbi:hypothetical protein MBLNU459_g5170t1 [Dothideomycetes sp. NU459]
MNKAKRQFYESSLAACQDECDTTPGCIAVTFSNTTDQCTMYATVTGNAPSNGTVFANVSPQNNSISSTSISTTAAATAAATAAGSSVVSGSAAGSSSGTFVFASSVVGATTIAGSSSYASMPSSSSAPSSTLVSGATPTLTLTVHASTCPAQQTYTVTVVTSSTTTTCPSGMTLAPGTTTCTSVGS